MKGKRRVAWLLALGLLFLSACGGPQGTVPQEPEQLPAEEPTEPAEEPDVPPVPPEGEEVPGIPEEELPPAETDDESSDGRLTKEEIFRRFLAAMTALEPEVRFDVTGMTWQFGAENDLKNIYYSVLSGHPELKYAYDLEAAVSGDTAVCSFRYMPYKTGAYDEGLPPGSHTIATLHDAKVMAQSMNGGQEQLAVAITDPDLTVDDIQNALSQAGYGWIKYDLSRDGTEIRAVPPVGEDLDTCAAAISESFRLGGEVLEEVLTDGMTDREVCRAVYDYIVGSVAYDFRYYSDRNSMPYTSTVALGALRDGLAICGGYVHAYETLLDMAGIESYTVPGISQGEHHMWNYVLLDGKGYYCDPTADRGSSRGRHFLLTEEEWTALGGYKWDPAFFERISGCQ